MLMVCYSRALFLAHARQEEDDVFAEEKVLCAFDDEMHLQFLQLCALALARRGIRNRF